ncbi:MAG: hypothetical protein ACYCPW_08315 [Nitrososphaerales archaeon]
MSKEQPGGSEKETELTKEERELILKALAFYQIHLFDEISKKSIPDAMLEGDYKKTTVLMKKIHKPIENKSKKISLNQDGRA